MKNGLQKFGKFLSAMVMPNIGDHCMGIHYSIIYRRWMDSKCEVSINSAIHVNILITNANRLHRW